MGNTSIYRKNPPCTFYCQNDCWSFLGRIAIHSVF